ncbi:MAG: DMT family transporter [Candidatus Omnitrophica bacterium]|nr:DMT family transporter [Candidatus Omnitrophota bacterium]
MWLYLAFIVAFFTSLQDILSKRLLRDVPATVVTWGWWFFSLPFLLPFVFTQDLPPLHPHFWWLVIICTILLTAAVSCYIRAIRESDLSLTIPLMTFTPLFLLITSPLILKEVPSRQGLVGVILIVVGSYILFFQNFQKGGWTTPFRNVIKDKGARYMLAVAFIYSISGNLDKVGVIWSSPWMWIVVISATLSLSLLFVMFYRRETIFPYLRSHGLLFLAVGFFNAAALGVQMQIIEMTQVPYLIAIKRTSVIITALYGIFFLKEKDFFRRMIGIMIMVVGVFFIMFLE